MGTKVEADDVVMVDNQTVEPFAKLLYFALHKPKGYVCSNDDPFEKKFARELINVKEQKLLFHVGRLDKDSTGLIIYTNDGQAAQKIMHPSFEIEKEYVVTTKEPLQRSHLQQARQGIYIDHQLPYVIKQFELLGKRKASIILTEGKNREIRKIFAHFGYTITSLVRLRIGQIELGNLAVGRYRAISKEHIALLLEATDE